MNHLFITIIAISMMSILPAPSWAGGNPVERPDAEAMIKACWDASLEKRSGTNVEIREGVGETVLCLEERIVEQFKLFDPNLTLYDSPDDQRTTTEKVEKKLDEFVGAASALYWWIYNENPGCDPSCGTMYYTFHLMESALLLERMLKVIVAQRIEYGF
jgi:hypothetical protein